MPDFDTRKGEPGPRPESPSNAPTLMSLTPRYSERHHGVYLRHLQDAIRGPESASISNIALTGSYGIGKSSILGKLADDFDGYCVRLSLSTLGDEPGVAPGAPEGVNSPASITNRIQKEIVKQLLYREKPTRVRDSRFHRIGRFRFWHQLPMSALVAALLVPVIYVLHGADRFVHFAGNTIGPRAAAYVAVFTFLVIAISSVRYVASQSRLQFEKLGAGPATIMLSSKSDSYFDEYLDEIVYFFEKTKCALVIFEDIDRFDEPHIFETLRELNTILNNSKQLDRRIRFVYAMKDSIFERLESSQQPQDQPATRGTSDETSPRANRTKFFDLVVPVVPFITHRNARDLMSSTMHGVSQISPDLVDLAAKYITDMRMIKNIRNEFLVFKEKLDVQHTHLPGLNDDALFALILYKNMHLADFEKIKEGTSDLDNLYRVSRKMVDVNLRRLRQEANASKRRLNRLDSIATRSSLLGDRVAEYIDRVIRHLNYQALGRQQIRYTYAGSSISREELRTEEFWRNFVDPNVQSNLTVSIPYSPSNLSFSQADLAIAVSEELSESHWIDLDVDELNVKLEANAANQSFLRQADMSQLFHRPEFELAIDEGSESFKRYAEQLLPTPLAVDLIANGYINRNFTLYVSQYYAVHVSLDAMNYLVHHVQPNNPDTTMPLSPADVESVIHEAGRSVLNDRSMYNVSILDHLLGGPDPRVDGVIENLVHWGEEEQDFVHAYVSDGMHAKCLYRLMSRSWSRVFSSIDEQDLDDATRLLLIDGALQGASVHTVYEVNEGTAAFIAGHYSELKAITNPENESAASSVVRNLSRFGVILPALRGLDTQVRRDVISRHLYIFNAENLADALDGVNDYALDTILRKNVDIYDYVLDNLSIYQAIVEAEPTTQHTVKSDAQFIPVLQDVQSKSSPMVGFVARLAAPECRIAILADAPEDVWPAVLDAGRFSVTFRNVAAYTRVHGFDEHLRSALVVAGAIDTDADDDEADRRAWATQAINAYESIGDPAVYVHLIASLNLVEPLAVSDIQPQDGPLYGLLLQSGLLADTLEVYSAIAPVGAMARESFIAQSTDFAEYITPEQVEPGHVAPLLTSSKISDAVKSKMVSILPVLEPAMPPECAQAIGDWAIEHQIEIPVDGLGVIAKAGASPATIIRLLRPKLATATADQLTALLSAIGQPYTDLTQPANGTTVIPTSHENNELLRRLQKLGFVSRFRKLRRGQGTEVHTVASSP